MARNITSVKPDSFMEDYTTMSQEDYADDNYTYGSGQINDDISYNYTESREDAFTRDVAIGLRTTQSPPIELNGTTVHGQTARSDENTVHGQTARYNTDEYLLTKKEPSLVSTEGEEQQSDSPGVTEPEITTEGDMRSGDSPRVTEPEITTERPNDDQVGTVHASTYNDTHSYQSQPVTEHAPAGSPTKVVTANTEPGERSTSATNRPPSTVSAVSPTPTRTQSTRIPGTTTIGPRRPKTTLTPSTRTPSSTSKPVLTTTTMAAIETSPTDSDHTEPDAYIAVKVLVPLSIAILILVGLIICYRKRRKKRSGRLNVQKQSAQPRARSVFDFWRSQFRKGPTVQEPSPDDDEVFYDDDGTADFTLAPEEANFKLTGTTGDSIELGSFFNENTGETKGSPASCGTLNSLVEGSARTSMKLDPRQGDTEEEYYKSPRSLNITANPLG